jgi:hypothetical protein
MVFDAGAISSEIVPLFVRQRSIAEADLLLTSRATV